VDVIDRQLVTLETAAQVFDQYVNDMAPHFPAVVFPPGTTFQDVRKSKPIVFLAILCAGSGVNHPGLQRTLTKEIMRIFADRIVCNGEKSLELIQSLHISTLWYFPPDQYEELKFYQLIHMSAIMAFDVGLGRRGKSLQKPRPPPSFIPWKKVSLLEPSDIESRRSWLTCYFMCCKYVRNIVRLLWISVSSPLDANTAIVLFFFFSFLFFFFFANVPPNSAAMGLRRPNLVRWSPYTEECVETLETSPDALPSDKVLCQWVRIQHISEEVGLQFSMDDQSVSVSISDAKVQHALKGFERELEAWRKQAPSNIPGE
jgi:hypothetical protein